MKLRRSLDGFCPDCHRQHCMWDAGTPEVRTCASCGLIYAYTQEAAMFCEGCQHGWQACTCWPGLAPTCPQCGSKTYSYQSPSGFRSNVSCPVGHWYIKEDNMRCIVCGHNCVCDRAKAPKIGQIIRITQKLEGGITKIHEGPVVSFSLRPLGGSPGAVSIGDRDGHSLSISIARGGRMTEDATWEIILPPEPPNKSVWVCPESDERGKLAIWRRLDHLIGATGGKWFYPGSLNGATWEQVYNAGPGYLLEVKND